MRKKTVSCPSCGAALPRDSEFCTSCGERIRTGFESVASSKKWKICIIILSILTGLSLIFTGVLVVRVFELQGQLDTITSLKNNETESYKVLLKKYNALESENEELRRYKHDIETEDYESAGSALVEAWNDRQENNSTVNSLLDEWNRKRPERMRKEVNRIDSKIKDLQQTLKYNPNGDDETIRQRINEINRMIQSLEHEAERYNITDAYDTETIEQYKTYLADALARINANAK